MDLTGRLLEQIGQGVGKAGQVTVHTPHSLQLWCCRLTLMVKLRMFEQAEAEMRAFQTLDTPDLYFQYQANSYPGRRGNFRNESLMTLSTTNFEWQEGYDMLFKVHPQVLVLDSVGCRRKGVCDDQNQGRALLHYSWLFC